MIPRVAYVLGNGPTLPVKDLYKLRGAFTVGVNRILRSGFEPTVVVAHDAAAFDDDELRIAKTKALVLFASDDAADLPSNVLRVPCDTAHWSPFPSPSKRMFYIYTDTAFGSALWLFALGVTEVHMLGCAGGVGIVDGKTHFYGEHPEDGPRELYRSGKQYAVNALFVRLPMLVKYSQHLVLSDDVRGVKHVVKNQNALRAELRAIWE